jgi:cell division protein FtsW
MEVTQPKNRLRKYITQNGADVCVVVTAVLLAMLGVFAVFDATFAGNLANGNPVWRKPVDHFIGLLIAAAAYWFVVKLGSDRLRKIAFPVFMAVFALCILVLFFGTDAWGARRRLGFFQPAEFMKPAMILFCAYFASLAIPPLKRKVRGFVSWLDGKFVPIFVRALPFVLAGTTFVLIELEPDLGTAMVVIGIFGGMLFFGLGQKLLGRRYLAVAGALVLLACLAFVGLAMNKGYRAERMQSFFHRWDPAYVDAAGHQSALAEKAYAMAGPGGTGLLKGIAKQKLPAADTDFIFVTIAEELGIVGALLVIIGVAFLSFRLIFLSTLCSSIFAKLVVAGAGWWIGLQSAFNLSVAGVLVPSVGIPLPFISDGSSSLVALGIALGMCQAALAKEVERKVQRAPSVDRGRDRWARISGA